MLFMNRLGLAVTSKIYKCFLAKRTLTVANSLPVIMKYDRFWLCKIGANNKSNNCCFRDSSDNFVIKGGLSRFFSVNCSTFQQLNQFLKTSTCVSLVVPTCYFAHKQERNKSTKKGQKRPEYDSDSDSDEEEENIQGTKIMTTSMQSLRLDGILKKSLNMARNKVETAFYEGKIRVNGKKPDKKSFQLRIGDEVDLIKGLSPLNSEFINVSRIEILSVDESEEDDLMVKVRRTKTLLVENYKDHPWKKEASSA